MQATFRFASGASGTIAYLTGGNARFPKETMDATGGGRSARLDNFRSADGLVRARQVHDEGARRPGQGPEGRDGAVRRGRADRRPDADQPWTRCSPPRGRRSRWARACPAASRSGVSDPAPPRSSAGTCAGSAGCRQARSPGASGSRRCAGHGRAGRCARARLPRCRCRALPVRGAPVHLACCRRARPSWCPTAARAAIIADADRLHERRVGDARRRPDRHEGPGLVPRPGDGPPVRAAGLRVPRSTTATRARSATSSRSGRSTGCST